MKSGFVLESGSILFHTIGWSHCLLAFIAKVVLKLLQSLIKWELCLWAVVAQAFKPNTRQRQVDPEFKVSLVHSEFQDSQGCRETLSLETEQDNWCCLIPVFSSDSNGVEMNVMYNVYLFLFHLFYEENLWSVLLF